MNGLSRCPIDQLRQVPGSVGIGFNEFGDLDLEVLDQGDQFGSLIRGQRPCLGQAHFDIADGFVDHNATRHTLPDLSGDGRRDLCSIRRLPQLFCPGRIRLRRPVVRDTITAGVVNGFDSMTNKTLQDRLAVCSWSLQPKNPADLLRDLEAIGIRRVQCALDPLREDPAVWSRLESDCADRGFQIVSGMFGTVGEDYSTLESIRTTGGVVPDATWDQNWKNIQDAARIAEAMRLRLVTFHAGFLPHDAADPDYGKLLDRISMIADFFADKGIDLGFETGQESAETLSTFLTALDRPSVGVNFDPANMLLYDKGDPIAALRTLSPWLKQCHIKDAIRTRVPGTWGEEVVVGTGEVDWPAFLRVLDEIHYTGTLAIEREAGTQRAADIRQARNYLETLVENSPA